MFKTDKIDDLISEVDEATVLFRKFLHALNEHGGDMDDLNGFLADAKGDRAVINRMVRAALGGIWSLVDNSIDIGPVDFDPKKSFWDVLDSDGTKSLFALNPDIPESRWRDTQPTGKCLYRVLPVEQKFLLRFLPPAVRFEDAGLRELCAFAKLLKAWGIKGRVIIARGVKRESEKDPYPAIDFVFTGRALLTYFEHNTIFAIKPGTCFRLVRVYPA